MKIWKAPLLEDAYNFQWKNLIRGTFAKFGNEINIQFIQSKHPNRGNCQKFILWWKKDLEQRGFTLVSSTPISPIWRYICEKYQLKIYEVPM